jgi:hypothetical protein
MGAAEVVGDEVVAGCSAAGEVAVGAGDVAVAAPPQAKATTRTSAITIGIETLGRLNR